MATHTSLDNKTLQELERAHLYSLLVSLPYCYSKSYPDKAPETFINPFWLKTIDSTFGYDFKTISIEDHQYVSKQLSQNMCIIRDAKDEMRRQIGYE